MQENTDADITICDNVCSYVSNCLNTMPLVFGLFCAVPTICLGIIDIVYPQSTKRNVDSAYNLWLIIEGIFCILNILWIQLVINYHNNTQQANTSKRMRGILLLFSIYYDFGVIIGTIGIMLFNTNYDITSHGTKILMWCTLIIHCVFTILMKIWENKVLITYTAPSEYPNHSEYPARLEYPAPPEYYVEP